MDKLLPTGLSYWTDKNMDSCYNMGAEEYRYPPW